MSDPAGPILVTGATGNVGAEVLRALVAAGAPVRAALRDPDAAIVLGQSVERVRFDFADPGTFAAALAGARGLFLMRPTQILRVGRTLNALIERAAAAGLPVTFLSVEGVERNRLIPHHAVERHLRMRSARWTMLRAGFFAQNLTGPYLRDIREGRIVLPAGAGRVAFIDAADIGEVAATALLNPGDHEGRAYTLTGQEALSFDEVAMLLTGLLGRPVTYEPASFPRYWRHARRQGVPRAQAAVYALLHMGLRNGAGAGIDPALPRLLDRPARTLRQFIVDHAAQLRGSPPSPPSRKFQP